MERKNRDSIEQIAEDDNGIDDAVIAADDTGMLAEERLTVETEIAQELEGEPDSGA